MGVGDARRLLRRAVLRPGALVRPRAGRRRRAVRPHRHLRRGRGVLRPRHDRRRARRDPAGARAFPMRDGDACDAAVAVASAILYAAGITLAVVIPVAIVAGTGISLFDVWWLTALAERIPRRSSRASRSYDWMVSLALMPLGFVLAGPLAHALGAVEVMLGGSLLAIVAVLAAGCCRAKRGCSSAWSAADPSSPRGGAASALSSPAAAARCARVAARPHDGAAHKLRGVDFLLAKDDLHRCALRRGRAARARAGARRCCAVERFGLTRRTTSPTRCSARRCPTGASSRPRRAGAGCRCGASRRSSRAAHDGARGGDARVRVPAALQRAASSSRRASDDARLLRRLAAPREAAGRLQRVRPRRRRPGLRRRSRGRADAAAAAVLHLLPDRRLPRRSRAVRRRARRSCRAPRARPPAPRLPALPARGRARSSA